MTLWSTWLTGPRNKIPKVFAVFGFIHETPHKTHLIIWSFDFFRRFFCEEKLKKDIEGLIDPEEPRDGSATVGFLLDEHFAMSKVNDVWMYIYIVNIHDICSKFGYFLLHVFGLFDYVWELFSYWFDNDASLLHLPTTIVMIIKIDNQETCHCWKIPPWMYRLMHLFQFRANKTLGFSLSGPTSNSGKNCKLLYEFPTKVTWDVILVVTGILGVMPPGSPPTFSRRQGSGPWNGREMGKHRPAGPGHVTLDFRYTPEN